MNKNPLGILNELDPELLKSVQATRELAFKDGALSAKEKILIALAIDASKGAIEGVKSLAKQALEKDVTMDEIMETIRIVNYICGAGSIYGVARALEEIQK